MQLKVALAKLGIFKGMSCVFFDIITIIFGRVLMAADRWAENTRAAAAPCKQEDAVARSIYIIRYRLSVKVALGLKGSLTATARCHDGL